MYAAHYRTPEFKAASVAASRILRRLGIHDAATLTPGSTTPRALANKSAAQLVNLHALAVAALVKRGGFNASFLPCPSRAVAIRNARTLKAVTAAILAIACPPHIVGEWSAHFRAAAWRARDAIGEQESNPYGGPSATALGYRSAQPDAVYGAYGPGSMGGPL